VIRIPIVTITHVQHGHVVEGAALGLDPSAFEALDVGADLVERAGFAEVAVQVAAAEVAVPPEDLGRIAAALQVRAKGWRAPVARTGPAHVQIRT
jgi:hypothetical protein